MYVRIVTKNINPIHPYPNFEGKDLIKKILVPIDGSEHANHALNFALEIAEKFSATIAILSVFHFIYIPISNIEESQDFLPPEIYQEMLEEQKNQHKNMLSEALKKVIKTNPNLKISTKLVEGRPADKIVETAKQEEFDIIIMGNRGLGGVKGYILGSVSDRVADHASCPVLVVK